MDEPSACPRMHPRRCCRRCRGGDEDDADAEKKTLPELAVMLPAIPKYENLLEFQASAASTSHYFIDAASIRIEKDGTVRYTLVVKGRGGGENISYEAIRCDTLEQKVLRVRAPEWHLVECEEVPGANSVQDRNLQYAAVHRIIFVLTANRYGPPKDAIRHLSTAFLMGSRPAQGTATKQARALRLL